MTTENKTESNLRLDQLFLFTFDCWYEVSPASRKIRRLTVEEEIKLEGYGFRADHVDYESYKQFGICKGYICFKLACEQRYPNGDDRLLLRIKKIGNEKTHYPIGITPWFEDIVAELEAGEN